MGSRLEKPQKKVLEGSWGGTAVIPARTPVPDDVKVQAVTHGGVSYLAPSGQTYLVIHYDEARVSGVRESLSHTVIHVSTGADGCCAVADRNSGSCAVSTVNGLIRSPDNVFRHPAPASLSSPLRTWSCSPYSIGYDASLIAFLGASAQRV